MSEENSKRPLSPHLEAYRLPYNALMSIVGRGVGIGLSKGVYITLLWLVAVIWYPPFYEPSMAFLTHPALGYFFLFCAFVVFFYLGNGVRHVLWDFVIGVHHKTGKMTGNIVLVVSALLTLGLWMWG